MADTKVSALTALAATPATNDLYTIVDVSDTTMAASGTNKKISAVYVAHTNGSVVLLNGPGTVTLPTSGTAALRNTANTFTAVQTFSAGISLGNETMEYYDEGTWTPALSFGGGTVGITYATQSGRYVRIGDLVWFVANIILSNKGSSTGAAVVGGLPATANSNVSCNLTAYSVTGLSGMLQALVVGSSTNINLYDMNHSAGAALATDADFGNSSALYLSGSYQV